MGDEHPSYDASRTLRAVIDSGLFDGLDEQWLAKWVSEDPRGWATALAERQNPGSDDPRPWPVVRYIYYLQDLQGRRPVKIGTASNLERRIEAIRADLLKKNFRPQLTILGVERWYGPHARVAEAFAHRRFKSSRIKKTLRGREWFWPTPDLIAYIQENSSPANEVHRAPVNRLKHFPPIRNWSLS